MNKKNNNSIDCNVRYVTIVNTIADKKKLIDLEAETNNYELSKNVFTLSELEKTFDTNLFLTGVLKHIFNIDNYAGDTNEILVELRIDNFIKSNNYIRYLLDLIDVFNSLIAEQRDLLIQIYKINLPLQINAEFIHLNKVERGESNS